MENHFHVLSLVTIAPYYVVIIGHRIIKITIRALRDLEPLTCIGSWWSWSGQRWIALCTYNNNNHRLAPTCAGDSHRPWRIHQVQILKTTIKKERMKKGRGNQGHGLFV